MVQVEHRLGDHVLGAGLDFPFEAADLLVQVERPGVGAHADQQGGLRPHGIAADIQAVVEVVDDVDQADGVHVEDRRGIRVGSHARRVAGDTDQVADAGRMGAQQLRLDAQDVAVAAAEVVDGFDAGLLLDELAGDLGAHAGAGARAIGNVDAVDAVLGAEARAIDFAGGVHAAGRQDLHEGHELLFGQLLAQLALAGHGQPFERVSADLRLADGHRRGFFLRGCRERVSERISLMWSGVVPQQPPITLTPAHSRRRAYCAMYSGEQR